VASYSRAWPSPPDILAVLAADNGRAPCAGRRAWVPFTPEGCLLAAEPEAHRAPFGAWEQWKSDGPEKFPLGARPGTAPAPRTTAQ